MVTSQCSVPAEWTIDRRRLAEVVIFHLPNFREVGDARKYSGQPLTLFLELL